MPQIRVKNGPQKGKILPILGSAKLVIGRDSACGLQINDKGVSREHAEIFRLGEMVFIRDLGSRNGCYVNDEQVKEELLREGDTIRVGGTQLIFEGRRAAQAQGRNLQYEDDQPFKTSLELKLDDLYVADGGPPGVDSDLFKAVCQATQIVQSERDEKKLFERLLDLIQEYIPADHLYLFLREESTGAITPRAMRQKAAETHVPISRTILRRVITESRSILTADAMQDDRFKADDSIVMNKIRSVLCVPVRGGAQTLGAIYAVNTRMADTFEQSDLQLLTAIGSQLALSLENLNSIRFRRRMFLTTIGHTAALLESANGQLKGHAERVQIFSAAISSEMGLNETEALFISLAGLLHDIGKIPGVSGLSAQASERSSGVAHVLAGLEYLRSIEGLDEALPSIRAHHERYDGTGFPDELKGDAIPLGGRIIAVANTFDKLLYASGDLDPDKQPEVAVLRKAFTELESQCSTAFDPAVVRALIVAYRHGTLKAHGKVESQARMAAVEVPAGASDLLPQVVELPSPQPVLPTPSNETLRTQKLPTTESSS